jgi:hypothetical protein
VAQIFPFGLRKFKFVRCGNGAGRADFTAQIAEDAFIQVDADFFICSSPTVWDKKNTGANNTTVK